VSSLADQDGIILGMRNRMPVRIAIGPMAARQGREKARTTARKTTGCRPGDPTPKATKTREPSQMMRAEAIRAFAGICA